MKTKIIYFVLVMLMCLVARAQFNGQQDSTFGTNGMLTITNQAYVTQSVIAQYGSDNKIYVASISGGQTVDILLSRFHPNGTPDNTFGNNGNVVFNPSVVGNDQVLSMKLDPNNKIIITGYADFGAPLNYQAFIARFNANGSADLSFNQTGLAIMGKNYTDVWYDCELEPNGDITVVGAMSNALGNNLTIARYKENGSLDSSFGYNGVSTLDLADDEYIFGIQRRTGNKYFLLAQIDDIDYVLAMDGDGDQIYTFGANGKVKLDFVAGFEVKSSKLKLVGNYLYVVGSAKNNQTNKHDVFVCKMNTAGVLQQNFGINGYYRADLGASNTDVASDLHVLNNGGILLAGSLKDVTNKNRMATFLLASDGTLDAGYGTLGVMQYLNSGNDQSTAVNITKDNQDKLLLCGYKTDGNAINGVLLKLKTTTSGIGVKENYLNSKMMSLYPNPTQGHLTLQLENLTSGNIQVDIVDVHGRIFYSNRMAVTIGNPKIDLTDAASHLASGIYLVRINSGSQTQVQKLIKQ